MAVCRWFYTSQGYTVVTQRGTPGAGKQSRPRGGVGYVSTPSLKISDIRPYWKLLAILLIRHSAKYTLIAITGNRWKDNK